MKKIGITGNIGSGKSWVCALFEAQGIPVFYSDDEAKRLYCQDDIKDKYAAEDEETKKALEKNKKRFIHHDIRKFEDLDEVKELDFEFARYIPWIIRMTEG